jgi:hypothetical protein
MHTSHTTIYLDHVISHVRVFFASIVIPDQRRPSDLAWVIRMFQSLNYGYVYQSAITFRDNFILWVVAERFY